MSAIPTIYIYIRIADAICLARDCNQLPSRTKEFAALVARAKGVGKGYTYNIYIHIYIRIADAICLARDCNQLPSRTKEFAALVARAKGVGK